MKIVIRRSAMAATKAEREESLTESIEIGDVHTLLYERGEGDLADALTAHLGSREACAVADQLRSLARHGRKAGLFRDYRVALRPDEAARLGLVAVWYERVGRAGCHVWADLRESVETVTPLTLLPTVETSATMPSTRVAAQATGAGIMPDWLDAPTDSVWSA